MKGSIAQWILMSVCIGAVYVYAYGRQAGITGACLFVASIGLFIWALSRSDDKPKH